MDIFDFDISPSGPATKLDMGSCAYETGVTEGLVTSGGKNSAISWGGGLTYKEGEKQDEQKDTSVQVDKARVAEDEVSTLAS